MCRRTWGARPSTPGFGTHHGDFGKAAGHRRTGRSAGRPAFRHAQRGSAIRWRRNGGKTSHPRGGAQHPPSAEEVARALHPGLGVLAAWHRKTDAARLPDLPGRLSDTLLRMAREDGTGLDPEERHPSLRQARRRLGGAEGRRGASGRAGHRDQGRPDAPAHEPADGLRLSRLRLARPEAHVLVRVLRERRQGGGLGGDGPALRPRVLRRAHRARALVLDGLRTRDGRAAHASHDLRSGHRPLCPGLLGRGLRHRRPASCRTARSEHGRILHLGADLERGGVPLPAPCTRLRDQQLPRLLEHVPRSDERRPAALDRRRQGNGAARGFRQDGLHPDLRPESRHQLAPNDDLAPGCGAAGRDHPLVQSVPRAGAATLPGAAEPDRDGDPDLDADQFAASSGPGRGRHGRGEGPDEGDGRGRLPGAGRAPRGGPRLGVHPRPHHRHRRADRRSRGDPLGGHRGALRPARGGHPRGGRGLCRRRPRDRRLRDGDHPAPARGEQRPAARESLPAARQPRQGGRRPLPGARALERSGRPHRRHHRDAGAGVPRPARPALRLPAARGARPQCRHRPRRDAARRGACVHRDGRSMSRPSSTAATSSTGARR